MHLTADTGAPTLAALLFAARSDANVRDRDGYTPVDTAEYWAARAPARALERLAALAVILCYGGRRTDFTLASDPATFVDIHRRLADDARRSSRSVPLGRQAMGFPRSPPPSPHLAARSPRSTTGRQRASNPRSCYRGTSLAAQTPLVGAARAAGGTLDAPTAATAVAAAPLIVAQTPPAVAAGAAPLHDRRRRARRANARPRHRRR